MLYNRDPLQIAIIGLGMGKAQIEKFQGHDASDVVALCDTDENRLRQISQQYAISRTYTDIDELLKSEPLDAVVIATPNHTHQPFALKAFDAGLHVLCEKPLARNAAEAEKMVSAATERNCKLAVHYNHRMSPSAQLAHRYIEGGDLGEIYFIRSTWHRNKGIPSGASGWFYDSQSAGGGCFVDLGVHMIDMALTFGGFPAVKSVSAQLQNKFGDVDLPNTEMDVEDFGTAYIRCENGLCISVEISWASHAGETGMHTQIYGTQGGLVRRGNDVEIIRREHNQIAKTYFPYGINGKEMYSVQDDFVEAILYDGEPYCSGKDGLLLMRILDAIAESSRKGCEITVNSA